MAMPCSSSITAFNEFANISNLKKMHQNISSLFKHMHLAAKFNWGSICICNQNIKKTESDKFQRSFVKNLVEIKKGRTD